MLTNQTASVAAGANDIRDIKPPLDIPNGLAWLWWVVAAVVIGTLLLLAWRYFHRRITRVTAAPPVPAHLRAKEMLRRALAFIVEPKQFCTLVSDTLRTYLEERFQFRAPERTTEEFLHELQATDRLTAQQKESLGAFLQQCDLVKFAKYEPGEAELLGLHSCAVQLVEETEPQVVSSPESEAQSESLS